MRLNPETRLQIQIAEWLAVALPPDVIWYAVPNGGWRGKVEAGLFQRMGVRAGVPDLAFVIRGRAAFIELKAGRGVPSAEQRAFIGWCGQLDIPCFVARSLEDVEEILTRKFGVRLRARIAA